MTARRSSRNPRARPRDCPARSRRATALLVAGLTGIAVVLGCATPEQRYRVLSFLFDGVPPPPGMAVVMLPGEEAPGARPVRARPERPAVKWVIHEPECDECHDKARSNQRVEQPPELCWGCHDEEDFVGEILHGPFAAGECGQCHSPHKSKYPSLLLLGVPELCGECHDAKTFAGMEEHRAEEGDDCLECHNPHAAAREYMLEDDVGSS